MSYEDEGPDTWTGGDRDISEFKEQLRQLDRRVSAVAANTHVSQTGITEIHKNVRHMKVGVIWWQQATLLILVFLLGAILWRVW
jgi:hypothetical protein